MSNVLVISNHHRRSLFFEESMQKLWDAGFNRMWIQDTGAERWGPYLGPKSFYWRSGNIPYDRGVQNFKRQITGDYDTILMIDNDCFISDVEVIKQYIKDFEDGGYDFAAHHVSKDCYDGYEFGDSTICEVTNQTFEPADIYPGFCPVPHWENAYLLIKKTLWDSLTEDEVGHGRKWLKAIHERKAKMGAHYADYRLTYSHHGPGWFHVGNLFAYYNRLEEQVPRFVLDSELDMSRLGYFYAQRNTYGRGAYPEGPGIYPDGIEAKLDLIQDDIADKALLAWKRLTSDTCMENW